MGWDPRLLGQTVSSIYSDSVSPVNYGELPPCRREPTYFVHLFL